MNPANYFIGGPRIQPCKCGCGREVKVTPWQPRLEYYSEGCQRKGERARQAAKRKAKRLALREARV